MTQPNRATLVNKLYKVLKRHFKPAPNLERQPLLEAMLRACCLENARPSVAEQAYLKLRESFFDLNEIRVSTVRELAEVLSALPFPATSAAQIKGVLQTVFETDYSFDMEGLKKINLGQAIKKLEKVENISKFNVAYATQVSLGGHAIPLDKGSLHVLHIVGVISDKEYAEESAPGLERIIPKSKGQEFGSLLHQFGAELIANPFGQPVKEMLLSVNAAAKDRLPKRGAKKPEPAPPPPPPPSQAEAAAKKGAVAPPGKKKPEPTPPAKKPVEPPKGKAKIAPAPKPVAKPHSAKPAKPVKKKVLPVKKGASKPLAKKKPR